MQYVKGDDGEYIDTEERDLDGEEIIVFNANGYGSCDVTIGEHTMRWSAFDKLKLAMLEAEKRWR